MSDLSVTDDPTATALADAQNFVDSTPEVTSEGGGSGPAASGGGSGGDGPSSAAKGGSSGEPSMGGDAVMAALGNINPRAMKAGGAFSPISRKATSAVGAKTLGGAAAGIGMDLKTMGAVEFVNILKMGLDTFVDDARVKTTGDIKTARQAFGRRKIAGAGNGYIQENGKRLKDRRTAATVTPSRRRNKTAAEAALENDKGKSPSMGVSASLKSATTRNEFVRNLQGRLDYVRRSGPQGIQKGSANESKFEATTNQVLDRAQIEVKFTPGEQRSTRKKRLDAALNM